MKSCFAFCLFLFIHSSQCKVLPANEEQEVVHTCNAVEFDVEFNHFVSNGMRAQICSQHIAHYNESGRMPLRYLGEEYNGAAHQNPCTVVCRLDPNAHETLVIHEEVPAGVEGEEEVVPPVVVATPYTYAEYRALETHEFHLAEHEVCGPQHTCDVSGCCVKVEPKIEDPEHKDPETDPEHKDPETDPEHKEEPKEPEDPHKHDPETDPEHKDPETDPEHKEPETDPEHKEEPKEPEDPHKEDPEHKDPETDPEHKEPEHKEPEPEPEKQYECKEAGVFVDPEDETSFFRCYFKSAHVKCAEGMVFNSETHECRTPLPAEPDFEKLITCSKEGYFRNPFDCKHFFRCYYNDESERTAGHLRVGFYKCQESLVFDSVAHTCVLPENTEQCANRDVPNEPEAKKIEVPDYEKLLKCEREGFFRNPYACDLFYRCYYNDASESELHLGLFECTSGQVFDEVSKNCVPAERADACHNKVLPIEGHYQH